MLGGKRSSSSIAVDSLLCLGITTTEAAQLEEEEEEDENEREQGRPALLNLLVRGKAGQVKSRVKSSERAIERLVGLLTLDWTSLVWSGHRTAW